MIGISPAVTSERGSFAVAAGSAPSPHRGGAYVPATPFTHAPERYAERRHGRADAPAIRCLAGESTTLSPSPLPCPPVSIVLFLVKQTTLSPGARPDVAHDIVTFGYVFPRLRCADHSSAGSVQQGSSLKESPAGSAVLAALAALVAAANCLA